MPSFLTSPVPGRVTIGISPTITSGEELLGPNNELTHKDKALRNHTIALSFETFVRETLYSTALHENWRAVNLAGNPQFIERDGGGRRSKILLPTEIWLSWLVEESASKVSYSLSYSKVLIYSSTFRRFARNE